MSDGNDLATTTPGTGSGGLVDDFLMVCPFTLKDLTWKGKFVFGRGIRQRNVGLTCTKKCGAAVWM